MSEPHPSRDSSICVEPRANRLWLLVRERWHRAGNLFDGVAAGLIRVDHDRPVSPDSPDPRFAAPTPLPRLHLILYIYYRKLLPSYPSQSRKESRFLNELADIGKPAEQGRSRDAHRRADLCAGRTRLDMEIASEGRYHGTGIQLRSDRWPAFAGAPTMPRGGCAGPMLGGGSGKKATGMPRILPATFGRYQLLRKLGEGGMGTVYLARDTQLDRQVALKVPRLGDDDQPSPQFLKRFFREARAAAALRHPNVCPIYDVGEVEGTPYLTLAYVEGYALSRLVEPAESARPGTGGADRGQAGSGDAGSARAGRGPPRPQALQHHDRLPRRAGGHGLRPGPAQRYRGVATDPSRHHSSARRRTCPPSRSSASRVPPDRSATSMRWG